MTTSRRARVTAAPAVPTECWYAVADGSDVVAQLLPVRVAGRSVVLFRTSTGEVAALEDCCAHRPYPLSAGQLVGDRLRCGLCGFEYDAAGRCVHVPSQSRVPLGATVRALPVRERDGLVWLWLGDAGRAEFHRVAELAWLTSPAWTTVAGSLDVDAGFLLLHESFADVTKTPVLAPDVSPTVLESAPPPLNVVVTETTVTLSRVFEPSVLPAWQAQMLGVEASAQFEHRQEGHFVSPAVWVDHWDVAQDTGEPARLRFTQLVAPIDASHSRLAWRVSRDFAVDDAAASQRLTAMFESYFVRLARALETAQALVDRDGPRPQVNVGADVAALKVRSIVGSLLVEEGAGRRPPGLSRP